MKNIEKKRFLRTEKHKLEENRKEYVPHIHLFFVMSFVICFMLLFAGVGGASATDYYVAVGGNNADTGCSLDHAWATPSHAALMAEAGDTIYLVDGTWYDEHIVFANSGTEGNPITVIAYNGTPTLDGVTDTGIAFSMGGRSYITIENLTMINYQTIIAGDNIRNLNFSYNDAQGRTFGIEAQIIDSIIHGNIISAKGAEGFIIRPGSENVMVSNNHFPLAGWNGYIIRGENATAMNNTVTGTYHNGGQISQWADSCVMKNETVYNVGDNGFYLTWGGPGGPKVYNSIVEDCIVHDISSRGIALDSCINTTIRRFNAWNLPSSIINPWRSENTYIIDCIADGSNPGYYGSIYDSHSLNTKIINTKFVEIGLEEASPMVYYYLDVLVQDENGNPVSGAKVTVPPFDVTIEYYGNTITVTPINLHTISREYTDGLLAPQPITATFTGTEGHTPLPSDNENTLVVADFRKDQYNYPTGPRITTTFDYTITAERDGVSATVTGINPDASWYREDPNTYPGEGKGTIIITLPTTLETGTISGIVTNKTSGAPIVGVRVEAGAWHDNTDENGGYTLSNIPEGTYTVTASVEGYETLSKPATVVADQITTVNFSLNTLGDIVPPYTSGHNPAKGAKEVAKDTNIVVHVNDDGEGVDYTSVVITVEGEMVYDGSDEASYPLTTRTGTKADYTFTYDPASDFSYEQVVNVTVDAQDLASPANVMTQDNYSFTTESAPSPPDEISPAKVTDLAAGNPSSNSITLAWTAPGDDGNTGTASQYDIRYSTSGITEANWNSATQCTEEPTPQIAGSAEAFTVAGLSPNTTYYFALKTADEFPNWSAISISPSGRTLSGGDHPPSWTIGSGGEAWTGNVVYTSTEEKEEHIEIATISDTSAVNNADSEIFAGQADANFGSATRIHVRADWYQRIPMKWTLPTGTASIYAVKLFLYKEYHANYCGDEYNVSVHEILENWNENELTWNIMTTATSWTNPGCDLPTSSSSTIVDMIPATTSKDEWHTWYLKGGGEDGSADNNMDIGWSDTFSILIREEPDTNTCPARQGFTSKEGTESHRPYIQILARDLTGSLTSIIKDAEVVGTTGDVWKQISFTGTVPAGTSVDIQISSSDDKVNWSDWTTVQTSATSGRTYDIPPSEMKQYGKWRLVLNTANPADTPKIETVVFSVAAPNNAPYTPANPSPSDGATDVSIDAVLSWTGGDPDAGDTVTYDVYFGTTTSPPLVVEHQSETTYDPGTLDHSTEYHWQIVATDNHGASNESEIWNFTTTAAAPDTPPIVSNPLATPDTFLNDNGRPRAPGTNISQLSVTVTDDTEVDTVTIDLSLIGGSYEAQMTKIPGTDTWTITTNAVEGINIAHDLIVTATDISGNFNNTVSISLTVLRRSDVFRDNIVDMKDVVYITRYLAGLEPERSNPPSVLVGDVVGSGGDPTGDGIVNMKDAVYIARYKAGWEDEP
jgi:hypothetical protein